jgi:hypothetical protein
MTTSTTGGAAAAAALPLDWTRLGRGRGDVEARPCPDVLCNGCLPPSSADEQQLEDGKVVAIQGTAVLCLPDADNDWFQGYFFPSNNSSPEDEKSNKNVYKLLCVQQDDADPCLHCDDYQLWTVTVYYYYEYYYHPTAVTTTDQPRQPTTKKQQTFTFRNVVSRGGDSIRWHHPRIRFAATTVATGRKAHVLVERYFAGLLRTLQEEDEPDDDEAGSSDDGKNGSGKNGGDKTSGVAAVMPNVAVVTGDMTMWLPGGGAIVAKE